MSASTLLGALFARRGIFAVTVAALVATTAPAQVVLSNLATSSQYSNSITATIWSAAPFTTPATGSLTLDFVTLNLGGPDNTSGNFQVRIFSDNGSGTSPDTMVANGALSGTSNPATAGNYDFTASNLTLSASTNYWIVAGVSAGSGYYRWNYADGTEFQVSDWTPGSGLDLSVNGGASWGNLGGTYRYEVRVTAVPEPATLAALLGGAALTAGSLLRRKSRPVPEHAG